MTDQAKKQDASMDEILSSIRSIVNEEMDKKSDAVEHDVLELTEEIDNGVPTADLGVTSAIADAPDHKVEDDLIDINAFSSEGVMQPATDETVTEARSQYEAEEAVMPTDEATEALDELNAAAEQPTEVETTEASAEDMAAEMLGGVVEDSAPVEEAASTDGDDVTDAMAAAVDAMQASEPVVEETAVEEPVAEPVVEEEPATLSDADMDALMSGDTPTEEVTEEVETPAEEPAMIAEDDLSAAATETLIQRAVAASEEEESVLEQKASELTTPQERVNLKAIPSANSSLQVGFPLEVLAEALRPLVKDWVEENLQEVVERLVRDEIQKMTSRS